MHNKLFILGNGFDLCHGLPTRYYDKGLRELGRCKLSPYPDFANFLEDKYTEVYENFYLFACDERIIASEMWARFEELLANVTNKKIIKHHVVEDSELDGDDENDEISNHFGSIEARISALKQNVDDSFTRLMANALCDWILSLDYNDVNKKTVRRFSYQLNHADCVSFNYSHTLEEFYDDSNLEILHIHGIAEQYNAEKGADLVFGHGDDEESNKTIEEGSLKFEREIVAQNVLDNENVDSKKLLRKKVEEYLILLTPFMSNAVNYNKVYIIGHSFGTVDMPYFEKIAHSLNKNTKIIVSYYGKHELASIRKKASQVFDGFDVVFGDISINDKNDKESFWNLYLG